MCIRDRCLRKVKDFFKDDKVHHSIELFDFTSITPKGCGYHPDIRNAQEMASQLAVSYTHLDVYKRQVRFLEKPQTASFERRFLFLYSIKIDQFFSVREVENSGTSYF